MRTIAATRPQEINPARLTAPLARDVKPACRIHLFLPQLIGNLADRAFVIENGRMALQGTASALAADPRIRAAYLGL